MQNSKETNNHAFIDALNLNLGMRSLGLELDYTKFRIYLTDKYAIKKAFLFLGYIPTQKVLYESLKSAGFELVFKKISFGKSGKPKGNVDVDLTVRALSSYKNYSRALLITSDGDFAALVHQLKVDGKFLGVLSPSKKKCSHLLQKAVGERIGFIEDIYDKIMSN